MQLSIPNGYFVDGHAIFGDPNSGAIMSKFFDVTFPDLSGSDDQAHIDLEKDLRLILGAVREDERLQVQYYTGSDFEHSIKRFEDQTALSTVAVSSSVRTELASRYRARMVAEELIQTNVRLCISSRLPARSFDEVFKIVARSYAHREQFFNMLLTSYGGSVNGLDNLGHYTELLRFWSPGQARQSGVIDVDWLRSIDELCRFSGLAPRPEYTHGFYMDGYYFGILMAKTMPSATWTGTMDSLLGLTIPNLRVVLNMQPLGLDTEMQHEEERFAKLVSNIDLQHPSLQSEVGLDKHRDRMRLLMSNKVLPFKAQLLVIACERSPDTLDERMEALRVALGKTGCQPFQPSLPTSTLSFFNSATPGYGPWNKYPDYWHKMNDAVNVANMWPVASTPTADLDTADWICDGDLNNLIGGKHFVGDQPRHMLAAATTGAGKTVTLQTLMLQTAWMYKFIAVIDNAAKGVNWETTCQAIDPTCKTIVIRSNGDQTFNPFDTHGQPLTNQHLASATALCHLLVGVHSDQDKDKLRVAILAETIQEIYGVAFRKWRKNNPAAYFDLIENKYNGTWTTFNEAEFQNQSFATWTHDMFPTLTNLQDELHSASLQKGPHQELCATLDALLTPWLRGGIYGPIVDGFSNVSFGAASGPDENINGIKVVHIELGELGESESELRAVAGFLIANEIRNIIQGLPRGWRKQVVIEEMVSFLKIPNAEQICVDYWQTMRKFSCQMVAIFQNYSTLLEASPKVAKALVSNSSSLLLLRNHNREDLNELSKYIKLPEVIKDQIQRFPKPAELKGNDAYAGFVYAQLDGEQPKFTVGRNYISHEVERITSSGKKVANEMDTVSVRIIDGVRLPQTP